MRTTLGRGLRQTTLGRNRGSAVIAAAVAALSAVVTIGWSVPLARAEDPSALEASLKAQAGLVLPEDILTKRDPLKVLTSPCTGEQIDPHPIWSGNGRDERFEVIVRKAYGALKTKEALANWFLCQGFSVGFYQARNNDSVIVTFLNATLHPSITQKGPIVNLPWYYFNLIEPYAESIQIEFDRNMSIKKIYFNVSIL